MSCNVQIDSKKKCLPTLGVSPQPNSEQIAQIPRLSPEEVEHIRNTSAQQLKEYQDKHFFVVSKPGMPVQVKSNAVGADLANNGVTVSMDGQGREAIKVNGRDVPIIDKDTKQVFVTKTDSGYIFTAAREHADGRMFFQKTTYDRNTGQFSTGLELRRK